MTSKETISQSLYQKQLQIGFGVGEVMREKSLLAFAYLYIFAKGRLYYGAFPNLIKDLAFCPRIFFTSYGCVKIVGAEMHLTDWLKRVENFNDNILNEMQVITKLCLHFATKTCIQR